MEIYCDDRESKVIHCACAGAEDILVHRLTTGDFIIGYRSGETMCPLVVIERKTWADLAASLKDGRVNNVKNLREYRDKTGAKIAYLIEGNIPANPEGALVAGIPYANLRAHLDHLLFSDSIIELHSTNAKDSLRRLREFAKNLKRYATTEGGSDGLKIATEKRDLSDEEVSDKIWSSLRGISAETARALRQFKIKQLFANLTEEKLAAVLINGRKFGPGRAASLTKKLSEKETFKSVLQAVPGIGPKKTELILLQYADLRAFFQNWEETKVLIANIGPAALVALEKYL